MRKPRILAPDGFPGWYHCFSRCTDGIFFEKHERAHMKRLGYSIADFLGIRLVDFHVLSNHYHSHLKVPAYKILTPWQILLRVGRYHGLKSREYRLLSKACECLHRPASKELLERYQKRMGSLAEFHKLLKQRFTSWYNRRHQRRGPIWGERFHSVLVQNCPYARKMVSFYITLNSLRAGLVQDPKDYPYGSYGAALAGHRRAREGIMEIMGIDNWEEAAARYRIEMLQRGRVEKPGTANVSAELLEQVLREQGHLPVSDLVHLQLDCLERGLAIGDEAFMQELHRRYHKRLPKRTPAKGRPLPGVCPSEGLRVLARNRTPIRVPRHSGSVAR